jgi:hypothetical protein
MNPPTITVDVWMEKRPVSSRWVDHEWHVSAVTLSGDPAPHPEWEKHAGHEVSLFRDEAEGYFLNVSTREAKVFVMWRMDDETNNTAVPHTVTVSYNEAARLMDAQEKVEAVPIPDAMLPWLEAYVAEHYKPEPKKKRAKVSFIAPGERPKV